MDSRSLQADLPAASDNTASQARPTTTTTTATTSTRRRSRLGWQCLPLVLVVLVCLASWPGVDAMRPGRRDQLRRQTVDLFYHGFDNYMRVAFPEDEVRSPVAAAATSVSVPS